MSTLIRCSSNIKPFFCHALLSTISLIRKVANLTMTYLGCACGGGLGPSERCVLSMCRVVVSAMSRLCPSNCSTNTTTDCHFRPLLESHISRYSHAVSGSPALLTSPPLEHDVLTFPTEHPWHIVFFLLPFQFGPRPPPI